MKKVIFVKPVWLFLSGDEAVLPERVARWLSSTGYAYTAKLPEEPAPKKPTAAPPVEKYQPKLSTRTKGNKK